MTKKTPTPSKDRVASVGWWRANALYITGVTALTVLSAFSKVVNQFKFFIYPDSYYYLLIARNLLTNGHPTGTLGPGGMPFPPPGYAAMKATFPMIAAAVMAFGLPAEQTGHLVSGTAAVLAVPMAFWATWRLLRSKPAALTAAALVAVSYGVTYWAGFVMSDSVSVLLGFALLAALAKERPDELSNPGDIGAGVVAAFLLLSRPTYFVALPLLLWMGFSAFGWTWKRTATLAVSCVLPVAVISALWFPPPAFSGRILLRLLPVIAGAAAITLVAVLIMRRRGEQTSAVAGWGGLTRVAYYLLAATPLIVFAAQKAFVLAGRTSPFLALDRFVARDYATIVFVVAGAIALDVANRREIGGALLAAAAVLLGVYFWVEPRDSRYLIHLLPFLVPVAAATVMLPELTTLGGSAKGRSRGKPPTWAHGMSIAMVVALVSTMALQGWRGTSRAQASFLATDYPSEVAAGIRPALGSDGVLVTALPWAMHFRTGQPAWAAQDTALAQLTSYVPADSTVLFLADASMRVHYPELERAVSKQFASRSLRSFMVPEEYLYGYLSTVDTQPVKVYRLTASEMRSLVTSDSPPGPDPTTPTPVR